MLQQYFARENSIRNVKRTRWNGASTLIYDDCFFHVETQFLTGFFFFCFSLAMFFELHDPSAEVWINCLGSNGSRISSAAVSFLVQFWWRLSKCWRCYDQWIDTHTVIFWCWWSCGIFFDRFERLEAGYSDTKEFDDWQLRMRQVDAEKELMEQERRRLAGLLSKEDAIIARQSCAQEKKDTADIVRAQVSNCFRRGVAQWNRFMPCYLRVMDSNLIPTAL